MKTRFPFPAAIIPIFCLLMAAETARAQTFTNSATLSAAVVGTNLVVNYSLTTTQGWVTLFAADRPEQLATHAQPVDLAQVPPSRQGQFTVPLEPAAPARFYKLLIEQWPSRGKALVFIGGPLDFAAMRATYGDITNNFQPGTNSIPITNSTPMIFRQPVEVWLDNLGTYDTNGVLIGDNAGQLMGKYSQGTVIALNNAGAGYPRVSPFVASNNDFRVNYLGQYTGDPLTTERQGILWSSQVQLYYDVNEFRKRLLTDAFIDELNLPLELAANVKQRQFRPDLIYGGMSVISGTPTMAIVEDTDQSSYLRVLPAPNRVRISSRTRGPTYDSLPPISLAYDSDAIINEYAKLPEFWIVGTNTGFPSEDYFGENSDWQSNMLPALSDGIAAWNAYRYGGDPEVLKYTKYAFCIWAGRPCGGTNIPCAKGENVRNVMMFDEANTTRDGVFPYIWPSGVTTDDGPIGSDLSGLYVDAIFYDLANEAGLGLHKADLLFWKTISLITDNVNYPMRSFGAGIQQAARALWPDPRPGRAGLSLYEEDVVDVLTSRGISMNGVNNFRTNLPVAIGHFPESLEVSSANGFGSAHPESQPNSVSYGVANFSINGYIQTNATSGDYVAYQFYKHSKYGPCDRLILTDGTFNASTGLYNNDGSFYFELTDRDLGNLTLFVPGRNIRWNRWRGRCPNEATGFYAEDVRPFGFRVIQATRNGFSFTATALSETETNKTYQLTIVDPSVATLGAATYSWTFTDYAGNTNLAGGNIVQYTALKDQPFTLSITRTRAAQSDTLTLRERGNDLDRSGGQAFVRNLVP